MHGPSLPAAPQSSSVAPQHSFYIWGISLVAALGGLLFGYDWVVIGGARQFYEVYFHLTSAALVGWANSCALIGCLLGFSPQEPSPTAMAAAAFFSPLRVFTAVAAPAIVFTQASLFIPESPRWLCGVGRAREAN